MRLGKCVIKLLIPIFLQYNLFLNVVRLEKCVIKQFINVFFVFDSIPDQYKTQGICDIVVSLYPFLIAYCPDKYKTQRMCDEAVDDSLAAWKLIPSWFVTSKMIKKFILLCTQMLVYSFLMKILMMSHFIVMKWVFFE